MEIFGIVIVVAIVGFIIWKSFGSSDASVSVSAPAPAKAKAKAPAPVVEVRKAPTKAQLSSKTKKEIDDLAKNEWGISLDARETKDKMIAQFIKEAKAIIKAENSDDGDGEEEA
jgi:hypothetical protein